MNVFENLETMEHEQVVFCNDKKTGLKAIIAIHDTTLGPALGGCRFWDYKTEDEALFDVLRLSRGMTYKAATAGLKLGGGKAVIMGDPSKLKSEEFFRAFGRFVDGLGGRYITAEDVNITVDDVNSMFKETKYVSGATARKGGSGNPSPVTALGTFHGIRAAVKHQLKSDSLDGLKVAVQGVGSVGRNLCRLLNEAGAKLVIADINKEAVDAISKEYSAEVVSVNDIPFAHADVFAPCALGAGLNDDTIPGIKAKIVAGAANNQLLEENKHGKMITERGILYAPDYVINAGGLINVYHELQGYNEEAALKETENIYHSLLEIFKMAEDEGIPTNIASDRVAELRIAKVAETRPRLSQNFNNQDWITV